MVALPAPFDDGSRHLRIDNQVSNQPSPQGADDRIGFLDPRCYSDPAPSHSQLLDAHHNQPDIEQVYDAAEADANQADGVIDNSGSDRVS